MSKPLKAAIEANDPEAAAKAIQRIKDIHRKLPGAERPILYAAQRGADKVIDVLVQAGALGQKPNEFEGESAFYIATTAGHVAVLERLWELNQASPEAVQYSLEEAAMAGRVEVVRFILERIKPQVTPQLLRLGLLSKNSTHIIRLLAQHGGEVNGREDLSSDEKGVTALHAAARDGYPDNLKVLVELGGDVNGRDSIGRTPLLALAEGLESIDFCNESGRNGPKGPVDAVVAFQTLLELGADAALTDNHGNDAITYAEFSYARNESNPNPNIIELLRQAGAPGSGPTAKLFRAIQNDSIPEIRAAIAEGADVNRVAPAPVSATPLMCAKTGEVMDMLLQAGADPNKAAGNRTALIGAARCGELHLVQRLVAAGADIHAVEPGSEASELPTNAYIAAQIAGEVEMLDYLKSLGARPPAYANFNPLKPGVEQWNDFSELLIKADASSAAAVLAELFRAHVHTNAHGQSFSPGKEAWVIVRPKGMQWSNVLPVVPEPDLFDESKQQETFARQLAIAAKTQVLLAEYSDTSDAASILHIQPDGMETRDEGWDRETLEEIIDSSGGKAPSWAKRKLAQTKEEDLTSTQRLVALAEKEKFVIAPFGIHYVPGRDIEIQFIGYPAEAFEEVVFVNH